MDVAPWKLMLVLAGVLALFAVTVSVFATLTGPEVIVALVLTLVFGVAVYAVMVRGYAYGQDLGEDLRDRE